MIDISFQLGVLLVHFFQLSGLLDGVLLPFLNGLLVGGLRYRSAGYLAFLALEFLLEAVPQIYARLYFIVLLHD